MTRQEKSDKLLRKIGGEKSDKSGLFTILGAKVDNNAAIILNHEVNQVLPVRSKGI